jgi:hypothetical protein
LKIGDAGVEVSKSGVNVISTWLEAASAVTPGVES